MCIRGVLSFLIWIQRLTEVAVWLCQLKCQWCFSLVTAGPNCSRRVYLKMETLEKIIVFYISTGGHTTGQQHCHLQHTCAPFKQAPASKKNANATCLPTSCCCNPNNTATFTRPGLWRKLDEHSPLKDVSFFQYVSFIFCSGWRRRLRVDV